MKKKQTHTHVDESVIYHHSLLSLMNNTEDIIWSVDRNFKLIISNTAFDEKVKKDSGRTMRKGSDVLIEGINFMMLYERAFAGEKFTETKYTNNGSERWAEIAFYPLYKGDEVIGVTCYSRDVTTLHKEDRHLKLLESVVTNATDAVLITEATPFNESGSKIMYVNEALSRMTGYTVAELIGQPLHIFYGPKSDQQKLEHLRKCFEDKKHCEIEIINYKKNGEEFWLHLAVAPVVDDKGVFTHFIAIGKDVTERLQNIEAIKEQNIKLTDIACIQSHDLRGPLARIMGLTNLLGVHFSTLHDNHFAKELIDHLTATANELDTVVKSIVAKAKEEIPFS